MKVVNLFNLEKKKKILRIGWKGRQNSAEAATAVCPVCAKEYTYK